MSEASAEMFLGGKVTLHCGDCLAVLDTLPENSVDATVTDPPYHLASIVKRFGKAGAAPAKDYSGTREGATGAFARASRGFMGQEWDGGDIAFRPETWAKVLRVMKPGGHLVAFSAPKNFGRMQVAIEAAGFETRDAILDLIDLDPVVADFVASLNDAQRAAFLRCVDDSSFGGMLAWVFGSGFPKSLNVSKAIDRRRDWSELPRLQAAIRSARKALGISQSEAARRMGMIAPGERLGGGGFIWFETGMRLPTREQWPRLKATLRLEDAFDACFEAAEREVIGEYKEGSQASRWRADYDYGEKGEPGAITHAKSDFAKQWEGWGTALKPAFEPIILARKPLIGTVAENVLAHGTGSLNIDGCMVAGEVIIDDRWPANLVHDTSVTATQAFPGAAASSASRFFYSAKANGDDRLGSAHPTVKPLALMQWLVRLVTPPGGLVLDPFGGTGTTAEAAWREGFSAVLIEREAEYQDDIRRRMRYALGGLEERAVAAIKEKLKRKPVDAGPLFGGETEEA